MHLPTSQQMRYGPPAPSGQLPTRASRASQNFPQVQGHPGRKRPTISGGLSPSSEVTPISSQPQGVKRVSRPIFHCKRRCETTRFLPIIGKNNCTCPGGEGQGSLAGYSPQGLKAWDTTEQLNSNVALVVKNWPANAGDVRDVRLLPGSGRFPGGGHGNPLQYSCLENPMDRGAWWATVHGVAQSRTRLR